jgi:hypothetical protein
MPLTVFDPRTGMRIAPAVSSKSESEQRARRWILRELDRLAEQQRQPPGRTS